MRKLWLAFAILVGLSAPAFAQTNCLVPATFPASPVVSTATSAAIIAKGSPGCLISAYAVSTGAAAGYLMAFNSKTVPADGAVKPWDCVPIAGNSYNFINFAPQPPEYMPLGITLVYSSTGCLTKTTSDVVWFHALVQ